MGKYDNFSNIKAIRRAQRKLDRLTRKRKPDLFKIELAKKELNQAKLFESCQIFKAFSGYAPNESVLFSDDNRVLLFAGELIRYDDIESYKIEENMVTEAYTRVRARGALGRAIVGDAIAGDVGAIVGAMTAETTADTNYYTNPKDFLFEIELIDGTIKRWTIESCGIIFNKIHPKWRELGEKLQMIIDENAER